MCCAQSNCNDSTEVQAREGATRPKVVTCMLHTQLLVVHKVGCVAHTDAHLHITQIHNRTATTVKKQESEWFRYIIAAELCRTSGR
jgi:hypothetical protein